MPPGFLLVGTRECFCHLQHTRSAKVKNHQHRCRAVQRRIYAAVFSVSAGKEPRNLNSDLCSSSTRLLLLNIYIYIYVFKIKGHRKSPGRHLKIPFLEAGSHTPT